jgi:hypothetical protein
VPYNFLLALKISQYCVVTVAAYIKLWSLCSVEFNSFGSNPLEYQYMVCHAGKMHIVPFENIRYKLFIVLVILVFQVFNI